MQSLAAVASFPFGGIIVRRWTTHLLRNKCVAHLRKRVPETRISWNLMQCCIRAAWDFNLCAFSGDLVVVRGIPGYARFGAEQEGGGGAGRRLPANEGREQLVRGAWCAVPSGLMRASGNMWPNKALLCRFHDGSMHLRRVSAGQGSCKLAYRTAGGIIGPRYAPSRAACGGQTPCAQIARPRVRQAAGRGHNRGLLCPPLFSSIVL